MWRLTVVLGILCCASSLLVAQTKTSSSYELKTVDGIGGFGGGAAAKDLLERNGFVVTHQQFRQIFEAYTSGGLPKFITTDSAWHTYHVLLEDGVKQLEEVQAGRLLALSRRLIAALAEADGVDDADARLGQLATAALRLQDPAAVCKLESGALLALQLQGGDETVEPPVGFPLDPTRFRAGSFYSQDDDLAKYFAARQWYAGVVFRLSDADETALAVKLALLIDGDEELGKLWRQLSEPYDTLVAPAEDGDVAVYATVAREVLGDDVGPKDVDANIEALQHALAKRLPGPRINDQLLTPEQYAQFADEIKGFRILPPRRLPSAVCFQNTVDPAVPGRMFPSGLDFLAACETLTSPAAQRALAGAVGDEVAEVIAAADCGDLPESLHGEALTLLAMLQEPRTEQAPAALRTDSWGDKQLGTQLAAWAEQRHTWALHAKLTVHYMGIVPQPPGVVSPYPEFFSGLADLSRQTADALGRHLDSPIDAPAVAQDLLDDVRFFQRLHQRMTSDEPLTEEEGQDLGDLFVRAEKLFGFLQRYIEANDMDVDLNDDPSPILAEMEQLAAQCVDSGTATEAQAAVLRLFDNPAGEAPGLLIKFADVCDTLATLAQKHLDGEALSKDEKRFIEAYGETLARFHFYGGNAWLEPRDDFPLIAPIFASPVGNQDEILYAALARPRALYVIAPGKDGLQLYRGAVLSYREFGRPRSVPLDDAAWREIVIQELTPPPPAFTASFCPKQTDAQRQAAQKRAPELLAELFAQAGADDYDYEAVFALCRRCRDQDVSGLVDLLATAPTRPLEMLTHTVASLDWTDQHDELMTLLHNRQRQRADSAAYILSRKPDQIPATVLIEGFDDQPSRTRRLYCFLLGKVAKPDAAVQAALIKALDDENEGIRWQAAVSIGWLELKNETTVAALIEHIDDNNSIVTGAVVMVLRAFDADEAAPAMLQRLQNGPARRRGTQDQFDAIHGEAGYHNGLTQDLRVMVLRTGDGIAQTTWAHTALCGALGHFEYAPAKETLLGMLHQDRCGPVLEALKNIDPDGHVDRLVDVVTNAGGYERSCYDREQALVALARLGNADIVPHLLPLLDDTEHLGHSYNGREWRLCDQAASTISTLLGWPERLTYRSQMAPREELIAKIRQWAAEQTLAPSD